MDDESRVEELVDKLLAEHDPKTESVEEFLGAQFDYGLAFVHFPEGHGGLDVAPRLAFIPAIAMFLTVLSFNLVGDTLRALTDPRQGAL